MHGQIHCAAMDLAVFGINKNYFFIRCSKAHVFLDEVILDSFILLLSPTFTLKSL